MKSIYIIDRIGRVYIGEKGAVLYGHPRAINLLKYGNFNNIESYSGELMQFPMLSNFYHNHFEFDYSFNSWTPDDNYVYFVDNFDPRKHVDATHAYIKLPRCLCAAEFKNNGANAWATFDGNQPENICSISDITDFKTFKDARKFIEPKPINRYTMNSYTSSHMMIILSDYNLDYFEKSKFYEVAKNEITERIKASLPESERLVCETKEQDMRTN